MGTWALRASEEIWTSLVGARWHCILRCSGGSFMWPQWLRLPLCCRGKNHLSSFPNIGRDDLRQTLGTGGLEGSLTYLSRFLKYWLSLSSLWCWERLHSNRMHLCFDSYCAWIRKPARQHALAKSGLMHLRRNSSLFSLMCDCSSVTSLICYWDPFVMSYGLCQINFQWEIIVLWRSYSDSDEYGSRCPILGSLTNSIDLANALRIGCGHLCFMELL